MIALRALECILYEAGGCVLESRGREALLGVEEASSALPSCSPSAELGITAQVPAARVISRRLERLHDIRHLGHWYVLSRVQKLA